MTANPLRFSSPSRFLFAQYYTPSLVSRGFRCIVGLNYGILLTVYICSQFLSVEYRQNDGQSQKLEGPKYTWFPCSLKLEGPRPVWVALCDCVGRHGGSEVDNTGRNCSD